MNRKTLSTILSKEKKKFNASVAKLRKLKELSQVIEDMSDSSDSVDLSTSDDIPVKSENDVEGDFEVHYLFESTDYEMEDNNMEPPQNKNLELKAWTIRNNVNHNTLTDLLVTLQKIGVNGLPLSAKSVLGTNSDKVEIDDIPDVTGDSPARAPVREVISKTGKHCSAKSLCSCKCVEDYVSLQKKVGKAKTQKSRSRNIVDLEDEELLEFSPNIPISSAEEMLEVETQLKVKANYDSMKRYLTNLKGFKRSVEGVLRSLFSDHLMVNYNLEGRKGKLPLLKLKCIDLIFDVFPERAKEQIFLDLRHFIFTSHNRNKQRKHKLRKKSRRAGVLLTS